MDVLSSFLVCVAMLNVLVAIVAVYLLNYRVGRLSRSFNAFVMLLRNEAFLAKWAQVAKAEAEGKRVPDYSGLEALGRRLGFSRTAVRSFYQKQAVGGV